MARTVPSLISRRRGTLAILRLAEFRHIVWKPPSRRKRQPRLLRAPQGHPVSCLSKLNWLAHSIYRKITLGHFPIEFHHQLQGLKQVFLCLLQRFPLGNRRRDLLDKAGVPPSFAGSNTAVNFISATYHATAPSSNPFP